MDGLNAAPTGIQASLDRPLPLIRRIDLVCQPMDYRHEPCWIVKDPIGLQYFQLTQLQYTILGHLDGQRTFRQVLRETQSAHPEVFLEAADIQRITLDLFDKNLLVSHRPGRAWAQTDRRRRLRRQRWLSQFASLLGLRLPGWDPEWLLSRIHPWFTWVFRPGAVALCVLLVLASGLLLLVERDEIRQRLPEFNQYFGWPNLLYLWLTVGLIKVLHEFGHGLSCHHYGGECHNMGIMLLVFSPSLYCDVSDSWTLQRKWERIIIAAAGMYVESVLSAIALFFWWLTEPGILHHLALNVFSLCAFTTVVFNANPLVRYDGYYILSDYLEIPNLGQQSSAAFREWYARWLLGADLPSTHIFQSPNRPVLLAYAVAAGIYRVVLVSGITWFLCTVLKPYRLQSLGICFAVISLATMAWGAGRGFYQVTQQAQGIQRSRVRLWSLLAIALVGGLLWMPFPWYLECYFVIEPHQVRHLYVIHPGSIQQQHVKVDDRVRQGSPIVSLSDPQLEDELHELQIQERVQQAEARMYDALQQPDQAALTLEKLNTIQEQQSHLLQQVKLLHLTAPVDGRIVRAEPVPDSQQSDSAPNLEQWHGDPLEPENLGAWLQKGAHVASIAPDDRFQAVLFIDQAHRNDLHPGQRLQLRLDHLPHNSYGATVQEISSRHVEHVPAALSNKFGGPLPTLTDEQGREQLMSVAYQMTVELEDNSPSFRTGLRGKARFWVSTRSLAGWIWRYVQSLVSFRL